MADVFAYEATGIGSDLFGVIDLNTGVFTALGSMGPTLAGIGSYGGVIYGGVDHGNIKTVGEEATNLLADTYATGSKGASSYGLKVIDSTRANSNAAFNLLGELMTAKSYSEVVELSASYIRNQFSTVTVQAKELAECVQKVATETADPIKEDFTSVFRKAA